jgi:hypothetical protein
VLISATALHWFVTGSKHSTLLSVMKWFKNFLNSLFVYRPV